ncbi:dynein regulatory complex protein 10 [Latimeria chalumnae]|uniref:Dynein regulatory complex protein 10 n=1 Tax=Latimeria chalumnae TaxID=7897 RepID=H3ANU4_LATCH|nr:PREDICTED: IQ domain-containing protein D [Latimeria chalumnae]|eukprot:XP_006005497.1 PREDICTED: IQ domain-containing protein D [Latimeria chalumnae]
MATEVVTLTQPLNVNEEVVTLTQPLNVNDANSKPKGGRVSVNRKKVSKVNALQILDPGRKKLTSIETQRIISVLEECIKKVEVVSLLPYAQNNLDRFSVVFGSELTSAIKEHCRLEIQLQIKLNLHKAEGILLTLHREDEGDGSTEEERARKLQLFQHGFISSVKNILRLFQANPAASQALRAEVHARDPLCHKLIQMLSQLRGFLFEKLLTTPVEEKEKMEFLDEITIRDQKNTEVIAALEAEVAAAIAEKDDEILKKNAQIRKLKSTLHQVEKFSEDYIRRTKVDAEKQEQSDKKTSEARCAKLQQEVQQLRTQLNNLITEHREIELNLRKRKYKVETEVENWIQKYDVDMEEKQEEYEQVDAVYTEEKAQLFELEQQFAVLQTEYSQIMEERRITQERRAAAEKEFAMMSRAAIFIQSFWKGYKIRKLLRGRKKKKKGKRKGKKGKK